MARQRMYLFERAYVDYGTRLRTAGGKIGETCGNIWRWFWSGPGANAIEIILRISVVIGSIALCVLYYQYENRYGRGFSTGTVGAMAVIFVFALIVLWAWKTPVHILARATAGAVASGLILVVGTVAFIAVLVVFSVYLLVLFILTALSFTIFLPMRAAQELVLLYRRIAYRCPYDDCPGKGLPIHICSCGREYDDLLPSFYGIFYHTCRHPTGEVKLPTMDFLGRNKLPRLCRVCRRPLILSSIGELSERPVAIVGGPSTGKTVFLRQATRQLQARLGALPGSTVRIDSEEQKRNLEYDLALLDRGQVVAKTAGDVMEAFGLALRMPKRKLHWLLYLYDAPGEHFLTRERFGQKQIIQHLAGIVLLVDPFSLSGLSDYTDRLGGELQPSQTPFHDVVAVLIAGVNQMLVRRSTDKCNVPLAVVMSKADAIPTSDFPFLADLCPSHGERTDRALSDRCRTGLEKLGAGGSIRALEHRFSNVRYFACSALGRTPTLRDPNPFQPVGVAEPFLWMLEQNGANLR